MRHNTSENPVNKSTVIKNPLLSREALRVIAYSENYDVLDGIKSILEDVSVEICTSSKELMLNCAMEPYPNMILLDGCLNEVKDSSVYRQLMANPVTKQIPVCCFNSTQNRGDLKCTDVQFVSEWHDSGRYSENFSKTSAFLFTHS